MTALEYAEEIARLKGGGINTEEVADNSVLYWLQVGNGLREQVFNSVYRNTGKIDISMYQTTEYNVVDYDSERCLYVTDEFSKVLSLDGKGNAVNIVVGLGKCAKPFRGAKNYGELYMTNRSILTRKNVNRYFIDYSLAGGMLLHIPGTVHPEKVQVTAAFAYPEKVKGFNIEIDEYPMPTAYMPMIKDMAAKLDIRLAFANQQDRVSNSKNDVANVRTR